MRKNFLSIHPLASVVMGSMHTEHKTWMKKYSLQPAVNDCPWNAVNGCPWNAVNGCPWNAVNGCPWNMQEVIIKIPEHRVVFS